MVDRFLVWLGTGVITAGISASVVAGAGVAVATDGSSSDGDGGKTSESSDNAGSKNESGAGQTSPDGPKDAAGAKQGDTDQAGDANDGDKNDEDAKDEDAKDEDAKDEDAKDEDAKDEGVAEEGAIDEEATDEDAIDEDVTVDDTIDTNDEAIELVDPADGNGTGPGSTDIQSEHSQTLRFDPTAVDDLGPAAKIQAEDGEKTAAVFVDTESEPGEDLGVVPLVAAFVEGTGQAEATEFATQSLMAPTTVPVTATVTPTPLNILLDVIGTIVFGLYGFVIQLVGGPPMLPAGSSVTVLSSRLRIDCGCAPGAGEEVPVDWYIPEDPEPDRLIYLQHGFLAAAPWYSYTAAALAERTHSIVVAPSITSNFLDFGQCWLGGAPMHQAMAGLFADGNTALAESALAAGYSGAIPDRVVLMGHSLGGGAVSGIAGYMTENGSADRLAGVVLLDGVGLNGQMANDLRKVDEFDPNMPIYQLAAPKYMWNMFGSGTAALIQARPDADFYGVTLVGGSHVDSMRGGNWLIQFSQQLVAGFSKPQNVAAASMLMVGWVNDMFDGDRAEGIYLNSGETRTIDTPGGQATLVDLPNSLRRPYLLNFLEPFMALSGGLFTLQPGCLRQTTGTAANCAASVAV